MSTKCKKPTGKVARTITAVKNIAKRLTAGKTVEKKEKPIKKAAPEIKPATKESVSKPTASKKKQATKPVTSNAPVASKPTNTASKTPIHTVPAIPGKVASGENNSAAPRFSVFDQAKNGFTPVPDAKPITLPGFEGISLFLHKGKNDIRISEASSGGLLATGHNRKVAVQMATDLLNNHGRKTILTKIQESINRLGTAPGFIPPVGGKATDKPAAKDEPKQIFKVTTDDGKEIEVTYTPGYMQHLEFRGEISPTGYHSCFGYKGELADVPEAARKKANDLRAAFLKEQARLARKENKDAPKPPQVTTRLKSKILAALVDEKKLPKPQAHLDEIVKTTSAGSGDVAATLMVLELSGKVKSLPGGGYRLPTAEEQASADARPAAKPAKTSRESGERGGKPRGKMSLLDAAVEVLKEAKQPLCCKDIIRAIFEQKLAESSGRTPQATLSAAIGREIASRGKDSRFKRADRGQYTVNF